MSKMKDKNELLRKQQKRPDKQLYVPRALRSSVRSRNEKEECGIEISDISMEEKESGIELEDNSDEQLCAHVASKNTSAKEDKDCVHISECTVDEKEGEVSSDKQLNVLKRFEFCSTNVEECDTKTRPALVELNESEIFVACEKVAVSKDKPIVNRCSRGEVNDANDVELSAEIHASSSQDCQAQNSSENMHADVELLEGNSLCFENFPGVSRSDCKSEFSLENTDTNEVQINVAESATNSETGISHSEEMAGDESWESMFNDEGECLDPKILQELVHIAGRVEINIAKDDYSNYQSPETNGTDNCNILELYGFPTEFKTQDLTSAFSAFQAASYTIKWVDDNHALAVFSSQVIANQALHLNHPVIKIRPLSEATKESKLKAKHCSCFLEPPKPRPATSAMLARRLVTGALGLKVHTSKEQREIERNMLREAKEKKKLKAKKRQDIWDGIVS